MSDAVELLPPTAVSIPGWRHQSSGKVRDVYAPAADGPWAGQDVLLVVASDRISAYDYILSTPIPDKGKVLTALTAWWLEQLSDVVPNHLISLEVPAQVAGRAMICQRLKMYPVECVARGYLTGSGLAEYRQAGTVCGLALPEGLTEASRLPEPVFTPAAKAELGAHDENVSYGRVAQLVGEAAASALRSTTLALYTRAAQIAQARGIILADTKFELGTDGAGRLVLGDEVLTPDSSRFWPADAWHPGQITPSFDKQYLRDWLTSPASGWQRASGAQPPALPPEVVERTRQRYLEAYERLTGEPLDL
ncbi:Phosphoribosylaminoimidazole-succinocarboxamide synthase [Actinomyces bovis]|uniref:Phosphoribosylaminoimidazole-succinocarboxamide synthase n=1 Tax=Actinomyces bovis TaxID=1658 RepID=A0ABY1VQ65_9ACTO|nr:phosphoribosylaminoimidazolesuccinocarboxamide synthase [Actinomyces bovis]SPT53547.1 Phosphoribosylaminoimidazole-succinocarboxamide synthase [Actinomyces bovis]VEG55515.1 Phosphoribosylaminoimidazole-succinocarboxamide synthase [Actinomyces israelii]